MNKTLGQELMIQCATLNKWYGEFHVLKDINLQVSKGEVIVICGPSGSGKSTLIRCMNGLELFQEGSLKVKGQETNSSLTNMAEVRRSVGMVFQQFNLFPHLSVLGNLTLAPLKVLKKSKVEAEGTARKFLKLVQIEEQIDKYPAQLSGGQAQRVAIARALCMNPEVLLFDEPTSALDPEMIKEVLDVMLDLAKSGVTMICVTHEMSFAKLVAHRVVFMESGMIVEDTPTAQFFENPATERAKAFLDQIL